MSLITDNQRKTAQEPEPTTPALPKPKQPAPRLQEFDQGQVELEPAPTPEAGHNIEFAAPGVGVGESVVGLTQYLGDTLGSSVPVIIPNTPAASTPPMTNLWKDATVDLGLPNLRDPRTATASYPTNYNDGFSAFDPGVGGTFAQAANATARADQQEQARTNANLAKLAQIQQQARGSLPNVPDASKPWHEQLWGWADSFLQGTKEERAQEDRTGKGTFGAYGSGLGGFFKAAFGVPIAAATATYLETWGREEYKTQKRLLRAGNPVVRTTSEDGKSSLEKPFMSLTPEEQHRYLTERVSNNLPLGTGALVRTNVDFRKGFGTYLYQALAGEKDDSINDANPTLAPVRDRRTGKLAEAKPAKGFFQSANLRPGQEFYDDWGGSALGLATQLFSPGNKVDAAGEILGLGLRALSRTNLGKATGAALGRAGQAVGNAIPKPIKQGASAVAGAAKRTVQGIQTNTFGSAPISNPTPVVGVPVNRGTEYQNYLNNQAQLARGNSSAPTKPYVPPTKAEDPEVAEGLAAWRRRNLGYVAPPVVPDVPAFNPTQTPFLPKTDPEGTAAIVGIGQKGQPLQFEPTVGLRTHTELVQQVLNQNPEKFGSYRGNSWEEWEAWKKVNLSEEDLRQLEAVGAVRESSPTTLQADTRLQPTLDDLQTQARVLAEQKLSVEAPLKQLEEVFDETVDVGRRSVDELPIRPLTEADVAKAIEYEAGLRLSRQLPASIVEAAARGDTKALIAQAEALGGMQTLIQQHNTALQDLVPRVTPEVAAVERVARDLPKQVYHGTALAQWQPYNVVETGSRGELGSALYTTRSYEEAAEYAKASVGNNRPVEIAYEPLAPQVVVLDTSKLVAPLDASVELPESLIKRLAGDFTQELPQTSALTYTDVIRAVETGSAKVGGSEELLQRVNDSVSDVLRAEGYDSVYDPRSGWLAVIDNGKLDVVKQESFSPPSAVQAAVARYNADSIAAGHFPENVTSDANLRDSAYQLLDQTRNSLDEKLEEVTQQLQEATYKEELKPLAQQAQEQSFDTLRARAKEPPSVERYKRDIQEFGQPLHPVLLRELPYNPRTDSVEFEVIGNFEAYEAAVASYDAKSYSMVGAMVAETKERVAGMSAGENYYLVDIRAIHKKATSPVKLPTTKEEIIAGFNPKNPGYTTAPVVLEQTSFETFRVLDRGFTANAYSTLYKRGERGAEMVPAMVVGKNGKAEFYLVDLAAIEKKAKALEPPVPKAEELTKAYREAKARGDELTYEDHYKGIYADLVIDPSSSLKLSPIEQMFNDVANQVLAEKMPLPDLGAKSFRELQTLAKELGLSAKGKKQELIDRIKAELKPTENVEAQTNTSPVNLETVDILKQEYDNFIPVGEFTNRVLVGFQKHQQDAILNELTREDAIEISFPGDIISYNIIPPEAYIEVFDMSKLTEEVIQRAFARAEDIAKSKKEASDFFVKQTSEELTELIGRYNSTSTKNKAVSFDTSFANVVVNGIDESKIKSLVNKLELLSKTMDIELPKIKSLIILNDNYSSSALKGAIGMDIGEGAQGFYLRKQDAVIVNVGLNDEGNAIGVLFHELTHAFEHRLTSEKVIEFRNLINDSLQLSHFPSHYGLFSKSEFIAELGRTSLAPFSRMRGQMINDEITEKFFSKWRQFSSEVDMTKPVELMYDTGENLLKKEDLLALKQKYGDIGEYADAVLDSYANPHGSLREALDEANNGTYDICNL